MKSQTKIPQTAHNQSRPLGPLPNLISSLRLDNRDQLLQLLHIDNVPSNSMIVSQPKKRLVFSTDSLRSLLLYHVLLDPNTKSSSSGTAAANPKSKSSSLLTSQELSLGLTPINPYGIVGTRVLFNDSCTTVDSTTSNNYNNSTNATNTINSNVQLQHNSSMTEVIYNPQSSTQMHTQSLQDYERDEQDQANVIFYFIHPIPVQIRSVSQRIQQYSKTSSIANSTSFVKHHIVFLPHINALSKRILSDENLQSTSTTANISIHTLSIDLIPLEDDVITCLELDSIIKDCYIDGIPSDNITTIANSLIKVQDVVGVIGRVQSYGGLGEMVLSKMMSMRFEEHEIMTLRQSSQSSSHKGHGNATTENPTNKENQLNNGGDEYADGNNLVNEHISTEVAAMILLDRRVDMVTPMMTPLTYEGLLDDVLKIDAGFIKIDSNIINPPEESTNQQQSTPSKKTSSPPTEPNIISLPLNDLDTLFVQVRDQHVETFGTFLQGQAKALKENHANFSDKKSDLTEIHQFVKQIPIFTQSLRSLTNHIHLAELVKQTTEQSTFRHRWQTERSMVESELCYDTLEDLIASEYPPFRLLRLLCLQSLTCGGLKAAKYDSLKKEVIQTYGYEYLFILQNLEKLGLIRKRESVWIDAASPFTILRKHFALVKADVDPSTPNDISYVSSGYAPISIRIIQTAVKGWSGKEEALKNLPGRGIDIVQRIPAEDFSSALKSGTTHHNLGVLAKELGKNSKAEDQKPILLVFFIGGVTHMEIASMRFLSKSLSFPYRIVCCTTKVDNGLNLLLSLS